MTVQQSIQSDPTAFLREVIKINDADDVWSDLEEPVISHRENFEFQVNSSAIASAQCDIKYLPLDKYIEPRTIKEYLAQFKELSILPATMIKTIVMDLVKVVNPVTLQIEMTVYMDGTVHTLVLSWSATDTNIEVSQPNDSPFPTTEPNPNPA